MAWVAPAIGAVASIAGSLLSRGSSARMAPGWDERQWQDQSHDLRMYNLQTDEIRRQRLEDEALQKQFAQMGIQWRVEDAKAAGLHPLFALGGQTPSFSPTVAVGSSGGARTESPVPSQGRDFSVAGQNVSRAIMAALDTQAREKHQAELEVLRAQAEKDYAQAAAWGSEAARARQGYGASSAIEVGPTIAELQGVRASAVRSVEAPIGQSLGFESVGGNGREMPPHLRNPHIVEKGFYNPDPFWQQFKFGPRFDVILPKTSEPQEVFEDKPLWFWAMVAKANVSQYGMGWLSQARAQFPSLRQVYDGVVQELRASGLWPR